MIKALLLTLLKNLAGMILTKDMFIWAADRLALQSDNLIDDGGVDFLKAALNNDAPGVRVALEQVQDEFNKTFNKKE